MSAAELPDYLPLFLEFLSTRPRAEACELLGADGAHPGSDRGAAAQAQVGLLVGVPRAGRARRRPSRKAEDVAALLAEPDPDANDLAALDAAWEDEEVTFGPDAGDSCKDGLIAKIRAGRRPAPGMPRQRPAPSPSRRAR